MSVIHDDDDYDLVPYDTGCDPIDITIWDPLDHESKINKIQSYYSFSLYNIYNDKFKYVNEEVGIINNNQLLREHCEAMWVLLVVVNSARV